MNRCLISSSAGAVSTHARGGLLVVSGDSASDLSPQTGFLRSKINTVNQR